MSEIEVCYKCGDGVYGKSMMGHLQNCKKMTATNQKTGEEKPMGLGQGFHSYENAGKETHKENFSLDLMDSKNMVGRTILTLYRNRRFQHTGNGKVYTVIGVAWMGELDLWGIVHTNQEGVICVRSVENFFGNRSNGDLRYIPIPIGTVKEGSIANPKE